MGVTVHGRASAARPLRAALRARATRGSLSLFGSSPLALSSFCRQIAHSPRSHAAYASSRSKAALCPWPTVSSSLRCHAKTSDCGRRRQGGRCGRKPASVFGNRAPRIRVARAAERSQGLGRLFRIETRSGQLCVELIVAHRGGVGVAGSGAFVVEPGYGLPTGAPLISAFCFLPLVDLTALVAFPCAAACAFVSAFFCGTFRGVYPKSSSTLLESWVSPNCAITKAFT